jgi:hypothetical protein
MRTVSSHLMASLLADEDGFRPIILIDIPHPGVESVEYLSSLMFPHASNLL